MRRFARRSSGEIDYTFSSDDETLEVDVVLHYIIDPPQPGTWDDPPDPGECEYVLQSIKAVRAYDADGNASVLGPLTRKAIERWVQKRMTKEEDAIREKCSQDAAATDEYLREEAEYRRAEIRAEMRGEHRDGEDWR